MPLHGSRLQLDGSRLLDPIGKKDLQNFMQRSFASILATEHVCGCENLGTYINNIETLTEMMQNLDNCFDDADDEALFEEYKASEHCTEHSSPEAQDALMERSRGSVFFFGEVYSSGPGHFGRTWAYKCEIEDELHMYQNRLDEYYHHIRSAQTAA